MYSEFFDDMLECKMVLFIREIKAKSVY